MRIVHVLVVWCFFITIDTFTMMFFSQSRGNCAVFRAHGRYSCLGRRRCTKVVLWLRELVLREGLTLIACPRTGPLMFPVVYGSNGTAMSAVIKYKFSWNSDSRKSALVKTLRQRTLASREESQNWWALHLLVYRDHANLGLMVLDGGGLSTASEIFP